MQLGVLGWSAAVALWSLSLLRQGGVNLAVGVLGLLAGGVPALMLIAGELPLHVQGFGAFIFAQGAWYLAVSVQLWRGRVAA